jgi:hypothetical protein
VQGQPEVVAEPVERVDDGGGAESPHPVFDRRRNGPRDHRKSRTDQGGGHGDHQIDLVVVGERQDSLALRVLDPGDGEGVRVAGVGGESGYVGVVGVDVQGVDAVGGGVEDDEAASERVQRAAE